MFAQTVFSLLKTVLETANVLECHIMICKIVGYWPFSPILCNIWVTIDVLCSNSSIIHICFISIGRYIGIRNPLHARQAPLLVSRRAVMVKIALVWVISAVVTSPMTIVGLIDRSNVQPQPDVCRISNRYFEIF
ncbi:5-hydroxytryptamine receptor 2C-like protein, partial [Leptotrombidium deliense]